MSVAWVALVFFMTTRFAVVDWADVCMLAILPVLALYAIGAAFVWIIEGFARADR